MQEQRKYFVHLVKIRVKSISSSGHGVTSLCGDCKRGVKFRNSVLIGKWTIEMKYMQDE